MKQLIFLFLFVTGLFAQYPGWNNNNGRVTNLENALILSKYGILTQKLPMNTLISYDDFLNSSYHDGGFVAGQSGTGAGESFINITDSTAPGLCKFATGTTTTGRSGLVTALNAIKPCAGTLYFRARVKLDTLSTVAAEYAAYSGLGNAISAAPSVGMFFRYARPGATGGQWKCWTVSTTPSATDSSASGITVAANTWYILEILTDGTTYLKYYINGVNVVTRSTNLFKSALGCLPANIISSAGSKNKNIYIDYYYLQYDLTTNR